LAADPVPEVPPHQAPDRAGQEADPERGERGEGARRRGKRGEELRTEDQRGRGAVDEVVVPLDGGADGAGHGHPAQLLRVDRAGPLLGVVAGAAVAHRSTEARVSGRVRMTRNAIAAPAATYQKNTSASPAADSDWMTSGAVPPKIATVRLYQ